MKLISNDLEGKYAVIKGHPITCLNPAPWLITEMKITQEYDYDTDNPRFLKIWIRGEKSMWCRADQCWVDTLDECKMYMEVHNIK